MSKNPFKYPLVTAPSNSAGASWELDYDHPKWLSSSVRCVLGPMSKEQAEYAAYAINTHDGLVAERDKLRAFVAKVVEGSIPSQGGNTPSQMVRWIIEIRNSAAALLAGDAT